MTKPWVDGSTGMTAGNMNRMMYGGDGSLVLMVLAYRIYYTGAAWAVDSTRGMYDDTGVSLSWSGGSNRLEITISSLPGRDFSQKPAVVVSATNGGATANYVPTATSNSATVTYVQFYDYAAALKTTESTQMDFHIILVGVTY
jgi:hypothetical protein